MEQTKFGVWKKNGFLGMNYVVKKENKFRLRKIGDLIFTKNDPFLNGKLTDKMHFNSRDSKLTFDMREGKSFKSANFVFYENRGGFIGNMQINKEIVTVKGLAETLKYQCSFEQNNHFVEKQLQIGFK